MSAAISAAQILKSQLTTQILYTITIKLTFENISRQHRQTYAAISAARNSEKSAL